MVSPQQDAKRTRVNDPEPMGPIPEFVECLTPHVVGDVTHVSDSMPSQAPTDQSSVLGHTDNEGHRTLAESVAMDISEGDQTAVEDNKTEHVVTAIEIEDSMDHTATAEKQVEEQVEMQVEEQVEEQVEMQVEVQVEVQVEEKVVEGEQEEEEEEAEDIPKDNPVTFPEISSTNGLNIESLVSFFLFLWSGWGRLTCVVSGTTSCCVQEAGRGLTAVDGVRWKTPTST